MSARARLVAALALALALACSACGVMLGGHGGAALPPRPTANAPLARGTWGGQLATQLQFVGTRSNKLVLGLEADARTEWDVGSRWTIGLQVGHSRLPDRVPWAAGVEWHIDIGTPIRGYALLPEWDSYAGVTAALRFWLAPSHAEADLNTSHWLLMRIPELLVYVRYRAYLDVVAEGGDFAVTHDIVLGVGFRFLVLSDLIE